MQIYSSVQKVSSHILCQIETLTVEDTRYKKYCTQDNDSSLPFKGTLGPDAILLASLPLFKIWQNPLLESPSTAPSYFSESHRKSQTSSCSKFILILGKARSHRVPDLGCRGAESPKWFDVSPKISAWDVMYEQAHCQDEAANHQLPTAVVFWIIQTGSAEECSSLMHNLVQICCSTCLVILNVTATQYTCSLMVSIAPTD